MRHTGPDASRPVLGHDARRPASIEATTCRRMVHPGEVSRYASEPSPGKRRLPHYLPDPPPPPHPPCPSLKSCTLVSLLRPITWWTLGRATPSTGSIETGLADNSHPSPDGPTGLRSSTSRMHTGIFTYKGTCTSSGDLVIKDRSAPSLAEPQPARRRKKARDTTPSPVSRVGSPTASPLLGRALVRRSRTRMSSGPRGRGSARNGAQQPQRPQQQEEGEEGEEENQAQTPKRGGITSLRGRDPARSSAADDSDRGAKDSGRIVGILRSSISFPRQTRQRGVHGSSADGEQGAKSPSTTEQSPTFKRVVSGAVDECVGRFEAGVNRQLILGVLVNIPWMVLLMFVTSDDLAYDAP